MTDIPLATPLLTSPRWQRWGKGLFGSPLNATITLACLAFFAWVLPPFLGWAIFDATWSGTAAGCAERAGACWAFLGEKFRFILFGLYPHDQDWRPLTVLLVLSAALLLTAWPRFWHRRSLLGWIAILAASVFLLRGDGVSTDKWGGLPLTILLSVIALFAAFPLSILLALGRRSKMGGVRLICIGFIEAIRGVPFVVLLYVAALVVPLMMPTGVMLDKLLRAELALTAFTAAYMAEIVRAGLQSVPAGQEEAAKALGLGYWQALRLIILPQALKTVIPSFVTLAINIVQDTTLLTAIGIFDFLATARVAANDPDWLGFYDEAFLFAAVIYLALGLAASRYSLWLEKRLKRSHR